MFELIKQYLDSLVDLSYKHSNEYSRFIHTKLLAHYYYVNGDRTTNPYLHPDTWQDEDVTYSIVFK